MSASSGIIAKGEKGKSKFQSLDINNLYKATESEPTQQKGTLLRTKNGMQSLGKVPTARRPPANLPSLKAENSGNEPAVSLVPAGAAGWGSKPGEGPPPSSAPSAAPVSSGNTAPPAAPVAVVTPVVMVPPSHEQAMHNLMPGSDKSWSAIMVREQTPNFLAHQSPQFQQEFPKLEGGIGGPGKPGDAQYGPGPSLRPQTEGSWTSGGGRPGGPPGQLPPSLGPGLPEPGGVRTNLGPHAAVGAVMGPAGPQSLPIGFPHGYRPLQQHPFMMPPRGGAFAPPMGGMRPRYPGPGYGPDRFPPSRVPDGDEPVTRPIIRDEELNKMDEIARDPGWAANEDIDYNQQLAFSDNEDTEADSNKKDGKDKNDKTRSKDDLKEKVELDRRSEERVLDKRSGEWDRNRHRGYPVPEDSRHKLDNDRRSEEDNRRKLCDVEEDRQRLREVDEEKIKEKLREEVAAACQLARQRKADEAKRFDESKRGERRDGRDWDDRNVKDIDQRKRDLDTKYDKYEKRDTDQEKYDRNETKQETEPGKYDRDHVKYERDSKREAEPKYDYRGRLDDRRDDRRDFRQASRGPQFKQLPPRLQALNSQRSTNSPQSAPPTNLTNSNFEPPWGHGRRYGPDSSDEGRDRQVPESYSDRYKTGPPRDRYSDRHSFPDGDRRHYDRKDRESDTERASEDGYKKLRDSESRPLKEDRKEPSEEREAWRTSTRDDKDEDRRPQRPDSRDSRTSRDSRNSREDKHEPRPFVTQVKEEKRREELDMKPAPRHAPTPPRENAPRHVPTPPRQEPTPPRDATDAVKKESSPPQQDNQPAPLEDVKEEKEDKNVDDVRQKGGKSGRGGRWGSNSNATTFVRNGTNRNEQRRRRLSGGSWNRPENESGSSGEGGSELEKGEKEERNRETRRGDGFAPSGQPSRRGRGAARVRGAPSTTPRRMDGYGPPPVKASFPQTEQPTADAEEDRTKQKQAALNAAINAGNTTKHTTAQRPTAPRMQRTQSSRESSRPKQSRGPRRSGGKGVMDGEEAWETMSNSDGEERKGDGRQRRNAPGSRGPAGAVRSGRPPATSITNSKTAGANSENKDEKSADGNKAKTPEADADSSQSTNDVRSKNKNKDGGYKGTKSESRSGPSKDRRNKSVTQAPAPNPNGPQPLMSQVVNPPASLKNYNSGGGTWRQTPVLPPRLQKQQDQQRQHANESHDVTKLTSSVFGNKEGVQTRDNAWIKPLGPPSRSPADQGPSETSSQRSSPGDKLPPRGDTLLDDAAPPVNTIIFENTNLKTGFPANLKQPNRVAKGNEWKPGEELFSKPELTSEPLPDHSIKPPLYRAEQGIEIDLLNAELAEMTEENAADLKHRLAGTKTLWDQNEDDQTGSTVFPATFCQDAAIDPGFSKSVEGVVVPDDCIMHPGEVVYSPASQPPTCYGISKHDPTTTSNVCKVKPQQQTVVSTGHSPLGHTNQSPLSPPPFSSTQQGQFTYPQAGLGGSPAQFSGMPAIPSPPAGLPYSSQQLQPSGSLFTPFQLERSQFSTQFSAPYGLTAGLGNTSTFNQPPLYLPHTAPPSDLFSSMSQYRVQHPSAHTNPNTVLLTSSSNSLISGSVKPSTQNIGVIGSKAPTFQQSNQMFIPFDAMQLGVNQSYLSAGSGMSGMSGMVQRSAPVQQPAPNFYSNSAGHQPGFYTASTASSGLGQPMPSLQQPYARQGFVNQSNTHNLQSYSSQVHLEMGYRGQGALGPASYLKSTVGNNSVTQQDVLASVFNSAPPKTRQSKQVSQPPPQQSPTQPSNNKFGNYPNAGPLGVQQQQQPPMNQQRTPQSNMGLGGVRSAPRLPTPIQRPIYRGRPTPQQLNQRPGTKSYYESQDGKIEEPGDLNKGEDATKLNCESKLSESAQPVKKDTVQEDAPTVKE